MDNLPKTTSADQQIEWLRKTVAPTVNRLVAAGFGPQVEKVLGFQLSLLLSAESENDENGSG